MFNIFQYGFIVRGIEVGIVIGVIAPLIGTFLVLRRYALIADTLAHVSLAGVAIGLLFGLNPLITAIGAAVASSVAVERLRFSKRVYADSALSIFLSGSLALAIVLISLAKGFSVDLFNYLFGSIVTVKTSDLYIILMLGIVVILSVLAFYKELIYITFDEEAAQVSGINTRLINMILIILSAFTVSLAIPIVGILLIAALVVIPVITAIQFKKNFLATVIYAEIISVLSVIIGIIGSFYLNVPAGGAIVLLTIIIFIAVFWYKSAVFKSKK
ncbi:MAG: metal ABC transporter permease [Ignavibacteriales bacterium]